MVGQPNKNFLFILNHAPYGDERPYTAFRLALNLIQRAGVQVSIFLTADSVFCARKGQKTPDGYYNIERMVKSLARKGRVAI